MQHPWDVRGLQAKLKHGHPGNKLGFDLNGKDWQVSYDVKSKVRFRAALWVVFVFVCGRFPAKQV